MDGQKVASVRRVPLHFPGGCDFPITKSKLPLLEISDYWSQEKDQRASKKELYACLESAWWLGEIRGCAAMSRLELLKRMFQTRDRYDGILFVVRGDEAPRTSRNLPDGSVSVDIRPEVPVPSLDTDTWDEANCQDAFDALAQATSTVYYPEIAPGLAFIELTLDEFTRWLRGRGYVKQEQAV